jgi:hypothetical protein
MLRKLTYWRPLSAGVRLWLAQWLPRRVIGAGCWRVPGPVTRPGSSSYGRICSPALWAIFGSWAATTPMTSQARPGCRSFVTCTDSMAMKRTSGTGCSPWDGTGRSTPGERGCGAGPAPCPMSSMACLTGRWWRTRSSMACRLRRQSECSPAFLRTRRKPSRCALSPAWTRPPLLTSSASPPVLCAWPCTAGSGAWPRIRGSGRWPPTSARPGRLLIQAGRELAVVYRAGTLTRVLPSAVTAKPRRVPGRNGTEAGYQACGLPAVIVQPPASTS